MPVYKIKKPDKEDAEKTFIGNCAGKIIFLSLWESPKVHGLDLN